MTMMTSIIFAYLVGMFITANRLSAILFWILNALFGLFVFSQAGGIYASGSQAHSIGLEIVRRVEAEGSEIAWLIMKPIPPHLPRVMFYFFLFAALLSVVFALIRRRETD